MELVWVCTMLVHGLSVLVEPRPGHSHTLSLLGFELSGERLQIERLHGNCKVSVMVIAG